MEIQTALINRDKSGKVVSTTPVPSKAKTAAPKPVNKPVVAAATAFPPKAAPVAPTPAPAPVVAVAKPATTLSKPVSGIKIDTNIPLPARKVSAGRPVVYQFEQLGVGHSMFVPGKTARSFAGTISNARKRYHHNYVSADVVEDNVAGVRVWRIEGI